LGIAFFFFSQQSARQPLSARHIIWACIPFFEAVPEDIAVGTLCLILNRFAGFGKKHFQAQFSTLVDARCDYNTLGAAAAKIPVRGTHIQKAYAALHNKASAANGLLAFDRFFGELDLFILWCCVKPKRAVDQDAAVMCGGADYRIAAFSNAVADFLYGFFRGICLKVPHNLCLDNL